MCLGVDYFYSTCLRFNGFPESAQFHQFWESLSHYPFQYCLLPNILFSPPEILTLSSMALNSSLFHLFASLDCIMNNFFKFIPAH